MIGIDIGTTEVRGRSQRASVRRMLVERRRELLSEIQSRVRVVREVGSSKDHHSSPLVETVDTEPEDDLEFALIQMKSEMLETVDEAVRRFDAGAYGYCVDCGEVITPARLRAMPLPCVVGSVSKRARTSSTASASTCSSCRRRSTRDTSVVIAQMSAAPARTDAARQAASPCRFRV
jgi:RNA polymerase-binding transcription factor DksA